MSTVPLRDRGGNEVGEIEIRSDVWGVKVNEALLHQAVVTYLANQRVGSASTKGRAEVRGGGRKPWRQKGLGRARHGSIRSPIWTGGGITFGPKPRDFRKSMNRKARRSALKSALSASCEKSAVTFLDGLELQMPRTKEIVSMLEALDLAGSKVLIVVPESDDILYRSARNIPGVSVARAQDLNVYQVLNCDNLLVFGDAVPVIEEVLGDG
ncbi:MAG: 50S ribosomal protein L4 [Bacillota bacterium]